MEYIILIIYAMVISINYHKKGNWKHFFPSYVLIYLYCIILFGLRYRVGIDTLNYMYKYDDLPSLSLLSIENFTESTSAPGWVMLVAVCKQITPSFYLIQLVVSLIFNSCLFVALKKYSKNPFLSFVIFMFMNGFYFNTEILKESIAVGIFLLNIENLIEGKWRKYYSLVFLSFFFHYSAIILLFFPLLRKLQFNMSFVLGGMSFVLLDVFLMKIISSYIPIEALSDRYEQYGSMELNYNWILFAFLKSAFIALCMLILSRIRKVHLGRFEFLLCLSILFAAGSIHFPIIFQRFNNYTCIFIAIVFTDFLLNKRFNQFVKIALLCSYIVIYTYSYYEHGRYRIWYPYHSILNEKMDKGRENLWFEMFPKY